jgi:hypothetical protein
MGPEGCPESIFQTKEHEEINNLALKGEVVDF